MNKQIGGLGLSPKSVEQLERVIDTVDTLLYPAHLAIGGWRLFGALIVISVIAGVQIIGWFYTNIQQHGFMWTWFEAARIAGDSPF